MKFKRGGERSSVFSGDDNLMTCCDVVITKRLFAKRSILILCDVRFSAIPGISSFILSIVRFFFYGFYGRNEHSSDCTASTLYRFICLFIHISCLEKQLEPILRFIHFF